jgi:hypothetical protein
VDHSALSRFGALVRRRLRPLIGVRAEPPADLLRAAPDLRRPRYRRGGLPPRIGGWALGQRSAAAITLWRTVWLADDQPWELGLLLHELRHVTHFEASAAFPLRYLWESVRRGYTLNRYEIDAREYAARRLRADPSTTHTEDV